MLVPESQYMSVIKPGDRVLAETVDHQHVALRAVSGVQQGQDMQIVWLCEDADWDRAVAGGQGTLAWPAEAVRHDQT